MECSKIYKIIKINLYDLMRYYTQSIISVTINNSCQINGFKVIINIYTYYLYN